MFAVIYYVRLPQPVGKDKYTFVHLLKESPYPALDALPIYPILFNAHILSYLFYYQFLCKYAISAIYLQKYKKIFRNVIIGMDM